MTAISNTLTIDYMLHSMPRGSFWRFISVWFSKILGVAILRHMSGWNGPVFRYKIANFNGEHTCQYSEYGALQHRKLLLCCCSAQVEYIGGWLVEVLCRKQSGDQPPTFFCFSGGSLLSCLLFLCVLHWLNSHWIEDPCFFFRHFGVTLARSLRLIFCGRKKNCYECCFQCFFINCCTSKPIKILLKRINLLGF